MKPLPSSPDDIAENRAGRLSAAQRAVIETEYERMRRVSPIRIVAVFTVLIVGAAISQYHRGATQALAVLAVAEAIVIAGALWVTRRAYRRGLDTLRTDRVDTVVGVLDSAYRSRYQPAYFSRFNGKLMIAPKDTINDNRKSLEQSPHRVYYLQRLERLVSFERA